VDAYVFNWLFDVFEYKEYKALAWYRPAEV